MVIGEHWVEHLRMVTAWTDAYERSDLYEPGDIVTSVYARRVSGVGFLIGLEVWRFTHSGALEASPYFAQGDEADDDERGYEQDKTAWLMGMAGATDEWQWRMIEEGIR